MPLPSGSSPSALRLINNGGVAAPCPTRRRHTPPPARAAAEGPSPVPRTDARWSFAALTASRLEGGRAAILRPEQRERLVHVAGQMGIRPFDAALVIALVQDASRRGEAPGQAGAGHALADRLAEIPIALAPAAPGPTILSTLASALFLGTALLGLAIMWLRMGV